MSYRVQRQSWGYFHAISSGRVIILAFMTSRYDSAKPYMWSFTGGGKLDWDMTAAIQAWRSSVEGREMITQAFPISVDDLFTQLFTNSKFYIDFHTLRKSFGEFFSFSPYDEILTLQCRRCEKSALWLLSWLLCNLVKITFMVLYCGIRFEDRGSSVEIWLLF